MGLLQIHGLGTDIDIILCGATLCNLWSNDFYNSFSGVYYGFRYL